MTMESHIQSHIQTDTNENELKCYIKQLSSLEYRVFEIASEHLCSSFSLRHSIGFIKWSENKATTITQ